MRALIQYIPKYTDKLIRGSLLFCVSLASMPSYSQVSGVGQYDAIPPSLSENTAPLIMLAMSVDHQLFFKAYTDYEDVNGDLVIDTTYNNNIEYAGYFDSSLCYTYSTTDGRFSPSSVISHVVTTGSTGEPMITRGYCNNGTNDEWSGNFLNWSTMTRVDEVRSILYGGYRSTDTASTTVLERSYLPNDAHSFAKYYNNASDIARLTPFGDLGGYVGDNTNRDHGITICNTTRYVGTARSQDVTEPPLARVVKGNYSLWSANERSQCLYDEETDSGRNNGNDPASSGIAAYGTNPTLADQAEQANGATVGDYNVRVVVCDSSDANYVHDPIDGTASFLTHACKQYPSGNYKPIGILQQFGEDDSAIWGLMSGSYTRNKSGGVLRKDIGSVANEVNVDTDGAFSPSPTGGGIIQALNTLRIANYSVDDLYRYNTADNCSWGMNSFSNGQCSNWGNPFAEILQECYSYFSGGTPNSAFNANDTGIFPGLLTDTSWDNPQTAETACAKLNVIAFNSSAVSYDADELQAAVSTNTNIVGSGAGEGISGNQYFVGENGASASDAGHELCTAKTVNNLSDVRGTCPDSPRLSGSYNAAGAAYGAYTTDLRTDLEGDQTVTTWGVELAPGSPRLSLEVPGRARQFVSILPACRNSAVGGNCGLVDFKIVEQNTNGTSASGRLYVNWEDSEQGGDYDQDMSGTIQYVLTTDHLTITTDVFAESTPYAMGFGYVVGGTTNDGFHAHSGANDYEGHGCQNRGSESNRGCDDGNRDFDASIVDDNPVRPDDYYEPTSATYVVGETAAAFLNRPLYYASKWGGFEDSDESGTPIVTADSTIDSEWDTDGDGLPDNYVLAINPVELKESIGQLVIKLLEQTASGTAAAVNAQTGSGEGAIYQALYTPRLKESDSDLVTWIGSLRSFFIDKYSRIREDTDGNGSLNDSDNEVKFTYDSTELETFIQAYAANPDGSTGAAVGDQYSISDSTQAKPIWDAQLQLASLTNLTSNRSDYTDSAQTGRYIFTAFDRASTAGSGPDGQVISPVYSSTNPGQSATQDGSHPFIASNFTLASNDFRYLGLDSSATQDSVDNLVNYIRGDESIAGDRNRTLSGSPIILGDIVHSTPNVVARPQSRYDLIYSDETYRQYFEAYENRRTVVYVGANDGMLHAFNGGFYNATDSAFDLQHSGETEHPLGSELWAYVPFNLLPHLQWLQDPNYPHVYYMDGPVQTFDVNIFPPSAVHPGGWGTILVAGMRFGGGDYSLDHDGDVNTPDITTRSAYVILDVTDPESPPELIAEITDEDIGFATSQPTVVKHRMRSTSGNYSGGANTWYLVFGSGPAGTDEAERLAALDDGVSAKSAKAYAFDLIDLELTKIELQDEAGAPEAASYTGGFEAKDWDGDFVDDAAYYGIVAGDAAAPSGKLKRARLEFSGGGDMTTSAANFSTDLFNDISSAFSATPKTIVSSDGEWWVYAGTGRFVVPDDNLSNQQQYFYGIKEPENSSGVRDLSQPVDQNRLLNTTQIDVFEDGRVRENVSSNVTLMAAGQTESLNESGDFNDVRAFISNHASGWYFEFETPPHTLNPRIRNTTKAAQAGESLIISAYEATGLVCDVTGFAFLYAPHIEVGIPAPFAALGTNSNYTLDSTDPAEPDPELVLQGVTISEGMPSDPVVTAAPGTDSDGNGCDGYKIYTQTTTGAIADTLLNCDGVESGRQSWREIPVLW